jgi:hypothetical protein
MTDNTSSKSILGRTPLLPKYINNRTPVRLDKNEKNVDIKNVEIKSVRQKIEECEVEKLFSNMVQNNGFQRFSLDNYESEQEKDTCYGSTHDDCIYGPFGEVEIEVKELAVECEYVEPESEKQEQPNYGKDFFNSHTKFFYISEKDIQIAKSIKNWLDEGLIYEL